MRMCDVSPIMTFIGRVVLLVAGILALIGQPVKAWVPLERSTLQLGRCCFSEGGGPSSSGPKMPTTFRNAKIHPNVSKQYRTTKTCLFAQEMMGGELPLVPLLLIVALALGFSAQGWINNMLQGDQGLGAFLKDGSGYSKSGFRPLSDKDRAVNSDPLPWLRLPKLDFVDVAGQQEEEQQLLEQLEQMRLEMNERIEQGKLEEAGAVKIEMERIMRENGIEYKVDE